MTVRHIELYRHFNARAATRDDERRNGGFNAWGNSFPREELPLDMCMTIGGLPFVLQRAGELDHIEAANQRIEFPETTAKRLALLAFGEMGPQRVQLVVEGRVGRHAVDLEAPGWLVDHQINVEQALCCTHLHYPGDYELAQLLPVMWVCDVRLPPGRSWSRLCLGSNPLFHVAAATLVECGDD